MLALLVAVVLTGSRSSLCATVGVGLVPPGAGAAAAAATIGTIGRRAVGVAVPGTSVVTSGAGPAVGVTTLIKPDRLPVIPQYARTFGSFSGALTGYIRDQWETRDGSFVRGGYSLVDTDGTLVIVEYSSDPINGFRVVIKRSGLPDYFLDSAALGGPLPGGYLPPFYSDFGFDYSDDYYGYDYDSYYSGGLVYDYLPAYYRSLAYDTYAPTFLDTYDPDLDLDLDLFRRRRSARSVRPARMAPSSSRS